MVPPEDFKNIFPVLLECIMARLGTGKILYYTITSPGISEEVEKAQSASIHKIQTSP